MTDRTDDRETLTVDAGMYGIKLTEPTRRLGWLCANRRALESEERYMTALEEMPPDLLAVCTAYESGFGHGVDNRQLANPYAPVSSAWFAYRYGYEAGKKRRPTPLASNLRSLLIDARQFVGKSRCSVGHSVSEVLDRAKPGDRHCLYCEHQAALHDRLMTAVSEATVAAHETSEKPFAGLLSWGLRPCLPHCELSIRFESVETAQAAREKIRNLIAWQYRSSEKSTAPQENGNG